MTSIAVVGAGQAGLQLALGLAGAGQRVTLVTDRGADDIRRGRVLSTQCMFGDALATERELGINYWEADCPTIEGIRYSVGRPDGELALQVSGRLPRPAQSVDQRIKMSGWLERLSERGGEVVVGPVDVDVLERLAREHDLVVVATGKGPLREALGEIFPRDVDRSPYDRPQRNLAVAYVRGMEPLDPPFFSICIVPGVGEYFTGPALTLDGPCYTMCFEPFPGGEMDRWTDVGLDDLDRYMATCLEVLERFLPWEAERCERMELTDPLGVLKGAITPTVRERAGRLPSGAAVLGIGDAVVLNDPLVGQGANNAAKGATMVLREILDRAPAPFDDAWIRRVGEHYWDVVRFSTEFTNMMLSPPPHVEDLFGSAKASARFADHLANGTNDPSTLFPWVRSAEGIAALERELERGDRMRAGASAGAVATGAASEEHAR